MFGEGVNRHVAVMSIAVIVVLTGILLAGCGGAQEGSKKSSSEHATSSSVPRYQVASPAAPAAPRQSAPAAVIPAAVPQEYQALKQHTRRPPDVNAQFEYVGGAGPGACALATSVRPRVRMIPEPFYVVGGRAGDEKIVAGRATFGQAVDICFDGFRQGPVDVDVDGPGGFTLHGTLPRLRRDCSGSECGSYDWIPAIDDSWPLGRYSVSGRSGRAHASVTFRVVAPRETGLRVLGPSTDPGHNQITAGTRAKVFLAGFKHVKTVRLVTYRMGQASGLATFFNSTQVQIPPTGNAVLLLPTGRARGETTFIITVQSGEETLAAPLSLTKPPSSGLPPFDDLGVVVGELPK